MDKRLESIDMCEDKQKKYNLVINYMEDMGIQFKPAFPDHINNRYRIMENNSSIFVYLDYFKMNLCEADKKKLENAFSFSFEPLFSSKKRGIRDNTRPWTCQFSGASVLGDVVSCLLGNSAKSPKIDDINVARVVDKYDEYGKVICPNCEYHFERSSRCPECGQLVKYEMSSGRDEVLKSIDVPQLFMELCACKTKKQLVETWNKYGLKTTTQPIDNETRDDKYLQMLDGSRIQISADSVKLWTSEEIINDGYFEKIKDLATPVNDGSYRKMRVTLNKTILNFGFLLGYFVENKLA